VGESASATRQVASGAIPAVLGGLIKKASTADGAGMLASMLDRDHDGSMLDDIAGMIAGGKLSSIADMGSSALGSIFSGSFDSIAAALGGASGVSAKSSSSIMKMLAPVVLGLVGKQKKSLGLDAGGLAKMLMGQSELVKKALPAGLTGALGLGKLGDIGSVVNGATDAVAGSGRATAGAARETSVAAANAGGSMLRKLLPFALLIGAAVLLWPTLKGCGQRASETAESVATATGEMAGGAVDAAGNAVGDAANAAGDLAANAANTAGEMVDEAANAAGEMLDDAAAAAGNLAEGAADAVASLFDYANAPTAADLGLTKGGVMDQFISFLKAGTGMDKTFTLDKVQFETGSNVLTADSRSQLDEVAKVLNAYVSVKVELQGHTDNQGGIESNLRLSDQRASAVKIYLESKGIAADRLTATGYGESKPMASNETARGRGANRRTDIKVTQK
jgi:outer membrane protein OmpA-like peptidoglycan-associated protein